MGLFNFNSPKAIQEAKDNPEKALNMLRKLIGGKRMQDDIQDMIAANLDFSDNEAACIITDKVGRYGVEVGMIYNEWLDAITKGYMASGLALDDLKDMNGEDIYNMLVLSETADGPAVAEKLSSYCAEQGEPFRECLCSISSNRSAWDGKPGICDMEPGELYDLVCGSVSEGSGNAAGNESED